MSSAGRGLKATISYNLSKKTKTFADMKGFPMLLNLSLVLHHAGFVLLLAFLLLRLSHISPSFSEGLLWLTLVFKKKLCYSQFIPTLYHNKVFVFQENIIQMKKLRLKNIMCILKNLKQSQ